MSYAEYGSRIFFTGINTQIHVDQKDEFDHRLKMIESCLDNRAWSSDPIENTKYFRETTEQKNNGAKIIIRNMTINETNNQGTENDSKNLEQELKQDHYHSLMMNRDWHVMNYVFHSLYKLINYKKVIFGESGPISAEIKTNNNHSSRLNRKNSNFPKSITEDEHKQLINNEAKSNTDISISLSSSSLSHENTKREFLPEEEKSKINIILRNKNYGNDENDDDNINNSLVSDELLELRKENSQLRLCLQGYDMQIKNLNHTHQNMNGLKKLLTQNNEELTELKNEVVNGKEIINQLKRDLEEKKKECDTQNQQLNSLKSDAIDIISIKNERDSLANTFKRIRNFLKNAGYHNENLEEDIKNLFNDYNELIILKKNLEVNCSESEAEIVKMYSFINQIYQQNEVQTETIHKLYEDIEQKTNLLNQQEEKITSLIKQCQEKSEIEKTFYENESINKNCDQAFAKYFQQSLEKLNNLTDALKDAGDDVQKRKRDINKLKKQMKENIQVFKDQFKKKNNENNFYRLGYEECQKIIDQQIEEIENLKKIIDKLEKKIIYKMELSVSELHQEHNNLTKQIQNLTSCIHERNVKIKELENEKINLLNRIDHTSAQLEEQNQQVGTLKKMNLIFREKLDDRKKNIESIFSALQSIQFQIEKVHLVSLGNKKVTLDENNKRKIDICIVDSNNFSDKHSNNVGGDSFINMLNQTEHFEHKLSSIKDDINFLSSELNAKIDVKNRSEKLLSQINEKSDSFENMHKKEVKVSKKMSAQVNESDERNKDESTIISNNRLYNFSQKDKDFNFSSRVNDIIHQNIVKKQSHAYSEDIICYHESNTFSKSSETQSLDDTSDFLNEITLFSSTTKNVKSYISDNRDIVPKQYDHVKKKSIERSTTQESEKSVSSSCNQFILHCSEFLSDEKHV